MNNQNEGNILGLFAPEYEGENTTESVHTPQTQDSGDQKESAPAAEAQANHSREEQFRALMEGEYKDLFTAYFQETFNRRFKEHKTIKAELEGARAVCEAAALHFGVQEPEKLLEVIRAETVLKNAPTEPQAPPSEALQSPPAPSPQDLQAARRMVLESIRARGARPVEGALQIPLNESAHSAQLSRAERAELARRAERGEKITL